MSRGAGTHGCTKGGGRRRPEPGRGSIKGSSPRAEMRRAGCGEKRRERTGGRRTRACPADRLVTGRAQTGRGAEKDSRRQLPAGQARRIGLRPDAAARRTGTARKCVVITGRVSAGKGRRGLEKRWVSRGGADKTAARTGEKRLRKPRGAPFAPARGPLERRTRKTGAGSCREKRNCVQFSVNSHNDNVAFNGEICYNK